MARIRTIKPEFWTDEAVGQLSAMGRLLFIATWSMADDEGLLSWNAQLLRSQAFPYDDLGISRMQEIMDEVAATDLVHIYKDAKGKTYAWIVNFRRHQKIDRPQPAKHPLPSLQNGDVRRRYADRDEWRCQICNEQLTPTTDLPQMRLSLDHIDPQAKGGMDAPSNIRAVHFGCNAGKKDRSEGYEGSPRIRRTFDERSSQERNGKEQGEERSREQGTGNARERAERDFVELYQLFPLKRDRGHALKSYLAALKKTNHATLMAGVMRFAAESAGKDPKFIAHPGTWLNGERWLDEPGPRAPPTPAELTEARMKRHFEQMGGGNGPEAMGSGEVVPLADAARLRSAEERGR